MTGEANSGTASSLLTSIIGRQGRQARQRRRKQTRRREGALETRKSDKDERQINEVKGRKECLARVLFVRVLVPVLVPAPCCGNPKMWERADR